MNEIEEFLKRAAAMRARQQQGAPATPPRQSAPPAPPPPQRPAPLSSLSRRSADIVEDAEVIEVDEVDIDDVAKSVARHLDSSQFQDRTSHLGERIKSADEAIESHLHETFEHRLGALGAKTAAAADSTLDEEENAARTGASTPAQFDLRSLLQSPQSLRNAIILSELLNPPHDRW